MSNNGAEKTHTFAVLVENKFGVLAKVASLFSARGYNIDSLCVGVTQDPSVSRITLVTSGDVQILEQIRKQLSKLIDTIKVLEMDETETAERELVLIKVTAPKEKRSEVLQIVEIFRARTIDISVESLTIEVTGDEGKIHAILELLRPHGIKEIARTGKVALSRGAKTLKSTKN
ncbi:MAG: acetolactate synthase small subunit [Nitrospinaceae bacterium]|jgi:acetolactate synthase I/III small subunit|nr:acetolactate synthase small subunit [Nitrospinaceae bacterium]MBT3432816.1 acetolactate synthase small subunit [Nitrospinaceae bacterium]MBT3822261.1 acetolactate synthase small subunit [Nitrospinaceae bacterium]MBT4093883.1 acetolactate synthase small subunit [Nitrospinaceae bacterium]MBT4432131.1 acetolactate synthase small subunit [Nitrospinaceae bacterium]